MTTFSICAKMVRKHSKVRGSTRGGCCEGPRGCPAPAFTFLELLVVVAILCLLAATLLPTVAKTGLNSRGFQCLNNNRRLCTAWRMYADDNHDLVVYASQNPSTPALNVYAWSTDTMDFNPNNRANWDVNYDIVRRPLWPYTGRDASIYRCPADPNYVTVNGTSLPRVRSMCMNLFLGGFDGTDGGWTVNANYRIFFKTTDLTAPGPAMTFVFHDERPDCLNWGNYMTDMTG